MEAAAPVPGVGPRPPLVVLDVPAYADGAPVLLATLDREHPLANEAAHDWQMRGLVVLYPEEARELHAASLLRGWTPGWLPDKARGGLG